MRWRRNRPSICPALGKLLDSNARGLTSKPISLPLALRAWRFRSGCSHAACGPCCLGRQPWGRLRATSYANLTARNPSSPSSCSAMRRIANIALLQWRVDRLAFLPWERRFAFDTTPPDQIRPASARFAMCGPHQLLLQFWVPPDCRHSGFRSQPRPQSLTKRLAFFQADGRSAICFPQGLGFKVC